MKVKLFIKTYFFLNKQTVKILINKYNAAG